MLPMIFSPGGLHGQIVLLYPQVSEYCFIFQKHNSSGPIMPSSENFDDFPEKREDP